MSNCIEETNYIEETVVMEFFELLDREQIRYVLIKNINGELPKRLKDGKDIDILVKLSDRKKFTEVMSQNGFLKRIPPLGKDNGYRFGYQLPEYQFWQKGGIQQTFYIDACFKLMCKSLTPRYWVPLDEMINERIWNEKVWDDQLQCWCVDEKTLLVYLLARSVFDKRTFSETYRIEIDKRKELLKDKEVQSMLQTIFYKYTKTITQYVLESKYEIIIPNYLKYTEY